MSETYQFSLPLVAAAQAQKHVTVNDALSRLDAVAQLRVISTVLATAPGSPVDGQAYIVAGSATGVWAGHEGEVAIFLNGGWIFITPLEGWSAWDETSGARLLFDGQYWHEGGITHSAGGAVTVAGVAEIDHVIGAGASSVTANVIPAGCVVTGVTGRVIAAISGPTDWSLGISGSLSQYGSGFGVGLNSFANGVSSSPQAFYADTPLELTANGGAFASGTVRLAVHYTQLITPRSV